MIDLGIVKLIQTNAGVKAIAKTGGFGGALPKDAPLPSWTYLIVTDKSDSGLLFTKGLITRFLQIDCYGETDVQTVHLAKAIDAVLDGFVGTLPDADNTFVGFCQRSDEQGPEQDLTRRTFKRMLEYEILYAQ